ncbi:hypothetical protein ZWY2020_033428 [Hordeum vulgare]|nr:hypothetical protein ZWY2020_057826 [Hordeum vulgare]KAI5006185.1 hypothetical protein ZWY2020_033428 [Hordeum vulgare]
MEPQLVLQSSQLTHNLTSTLKLQLPVGRRDFSWQLWTFNLAVPHDSALAFRSKYQSICFSFINLRLLHA